MSKKRVHELAKELGMDNREVVVALQAAGISVKTHSSSVYEEEALAVLNKMKGPTPAVPARRPGMVIVKKPKLTEAEIEAEAAAAAAMEAQAESDAYEPTESYDDSPREAAGDHVEAAPSDDFEPNDYQEPAESTPVEPQHTPEVSHAAESESAAAQFSAPAPARGEQPGEVPPAVEPKVMQEMQKADRDTVPPQSKRSETPPTPAPPAQRTEVQQRPPQTQHTSHGTQGRPQQGGPAHSQGGRPPHQGGQHQGTYQGGPRHQGPSGTGRPGYQGQGGQGQSRPQHHGASGPQAGGPGAAINPPPGQPGHDPNKVRVQTANRPQRPTTTPATVVRMIDRDKLLERVPGRRLGGGAPNTSGPRGATNTSTGPKYGQVTELKVVTDPFGRGREMITVGRDKKKAGPGAAAPGQLPGKGGPVRKGRGPNKRDEMRERAMHPSRLKKKKTNKRAAKKTEVTQPKASKRVIKMKETIVVADLAHQLGIKSVDIIRKLMGLGTMITQNESVDLETAQLIASEFEYTVDSVAFTEDHHIDTTKEEPTAETQVARPPVVTVMGHVDHGKTSLLDAIRKARVASGEAGGITQHIGAYQVTVPGKGSITFLDTPGHAAFTQMRARGAQLTDIVILVVAADDGVMPQTEEAIRHAQAAKVPIIVAVNKIDKPGANAERVLQELSKFSLLSEAWGGDTLFVNTSATVGTGVTELLEAVLLQAEVLELKANPDRPAVGIVIEAQLDKGRGPVATVLVQQGTLRRGDAIVAGNWSGKIRAMMDDKGRQVKEAGPSTAVEVTGLEGVPDAGDNINVVESSEAARQVAAHRSGLKRTADQSGGAATSLDDLMKRMGDQGGLELKIVLKADVQGSVEAVKGALLKLSTDEVKVNVLYGGVGAIKESDITLAAASRGIVVGFGVRPDTNARQIAEREGVEIRTYMIIYEAVDEIRRAMEGLLTPESREKVVGRAEVRELFKVSKVGVIGGCRVTEGKAIRAARVRVLRNSVQVFDGRPSSLKHFKNDAREVDSGLECGIGVDGYNDLKMGDVIEFYQVEQIARTLGAPSAGKRPAGAGQDAHP